MTDAAQVRALITQALDECAAGKLLVQQAKERYERGQQAMLAATGGLSHPDNNAAQGGLQQLVEDTSSLITMDGAVTEHMKNVRDLY